MVYLLCGKEPYLAGELRKSLMKYIENPNLNYRLSYNCGSEELQFAQTAPFLSEKKMLVLMLSDFSEVKALGNYFHSPSETTELLIMTTSKVSKSDKMYKYFLSNNWVKDYDKVDDTALRNFILSIIKKNNGAITEEAYRLLCDRLNYRKDENCNLYTVKTMVQQVLFFSKKVTVDVVDAVIDRTIDEDIFSLSNHLMKNERTRMFELADHLLQNKDKPIGILSLLTRNFRLAFKASLYKDLSQAAGEIGVDAYALRPYSKLSQETAMRCLDILQHSVSRVKSGCNGDQVLKLTLALLVETIHN